MDLGHARRKRQKQQPESTTVGKIDLRKNRKFSNLQPTDDGSLEVSVEDLSNGNSEAYCGSLIIAADGYNSAVSVEAEKLCVVLWLS